MERKISRDLLFSAWVMFSLSLALSMFLWAPSDGARLNLLDGFVTLPSLVGLSLLLLKEKRCSRPFLMGLFLLLLYSGYALLSLLWADSPNGSRAVRASAQVIGLYVFFSYLYLSGREQLLKAGLFTGCCVTALVCLWHLVGMYLAIGASISQPLYAGIPEGRLLELGIQPINLMHATLLTAPQAALLVGLAYVGDSRIYRYIGTIAIAILVLFLIALERRTGQVALFVIFLSAVAIYRNRAWFWAFLVFCVLGVLVYLVYPELILSRGTSWRPEIWLATLERVAEAPLFGHGVTNTVVPVSVYGEDNQLLGTFRHPHSMALAVAYYLGIVGLVLWVLLWVPALILRLFYTADKASQAYIVIPIIVGATVLLFDGEAALAPFHYDWYCFWLPVTLMLASLAGAKDLNYALWIGQRGQGWQS